MRNLLIALGCVALLATGCSGGRASDVNGSGLTAPTPQRVDTSILRFSNANYVKFDTPATLATQRTKRGGVVVAGTVEGFQRGPKLFPPPGDKPLNLIVMHVHVNDVIHGDRGYVHDGRVYLEILGGFGWPDPAPRFRKAIPRGTPIVAFGSSRPISNNKGTQGVNDGRPKNARLLSATHPQALIFQETRASRGKTQSRILGGREDLKAFGPAWSQHTSLESLVSKMRQDLNKN
jgi:hypothetical protein